MNTHELIESTMLHSLGLLDDDERQAFEAAYELASPQVQERVRAEAQRMADLGAMMSDVEPNNEMRSMVLAAVRAAMIEEANEARIATTIASSEAANPVVGRITADSVQPQTVPAGRTIAQPKLASSPRVHRGWRIATLASAAAAIAFGVVTLNLQQTYTEIQSKSIVTNLYDKIGAQYLETTLFDANTQRVAMTSQNQDKAVAAVWSNPDWDTARLFVNNLSSESNEPLRLVVLDNEGNIVREIATFSPNGQFQDIDVDVNLSTERKLAIYPPSNSSLMDDVEAAAPLLLSADSEL